MILMRYASVILMLSVLMVGPGVRSSGQDPSPQIESRVLTVCPEGPPACQFAKIGEAIAAALPIQLLGVEPLILIQPGTYRENLLIDRGILLVATEAGQVRIQGVLRGQPTLTLEARGDLRVALEGITVLGGPPVTPNARGEVSCLSSIRVRICPDGIAIRNRGGSLFLDLVDVQLTQSSSYGLTCSSYPAEPGFAQGTQARINIFRSRLAAEVNLCGSFQQMIVHLKEVIVSGNISRGISAGAGRPGGDTILVEDSLFIGNGVGLELGGSRDGKIIVRDSQFLHNGVGISVDDLGDENDSPVVEIRSSHFAENYSALYLGFNTGVDFLSSGRVLLEDSSLIGNKEGLLVRSNFKVQVRNNVIEQNDMGVLVTLATNGLELTGNSILRNRGWGVVLPHNPGCPEALPPLPPGLAFPITTIEALTKAIHIEGADNEIRDNGLGSLCPADYPWPPDFIKKP